jgi:RNA polymerase sigma factor for flagellar operon FliA
MDISNTEVSLDEFVKNHTSLVRRIAYHLLGRLPRNIAIDDLIQAGMVGLLEAIRLFDASKGAAFETYATIRIRGHILDEVRRNDWVPRSVYKHARDIASAVKILENRLGRDAKDHEVAEALGIRLSDYYDMLNDSNSGHLYGFDDVGITDDQLKDDALQDSAKTSTEPYLNAQRADVKARLTQIIQGLPKKEHLVLSLYYEHELNLKEIGDILGIGESRVSQLHSQAMHRIRARF